MQDLLSRNQSAIRDACDRYGVERLVVFGSVLTDRFNDSTSDVDFLVEFRPDVTDLFGSYFGLMKALQAALERPVDLIAPAALENPFFAESFRANARELYAA